MPENNDDIEELIHPDVVDDIIGKPPSWIVRRGTIIIIIIIAVVFAGALFIKYPDVIRGKVSIEAIPTGQYLAVSRLQPDVFYKIKIGQKAIIKLRDQQYASQGYLAATVSGIDNDMDSVVTVHMYLDKGLATSKGQVIPTQDKLGGDLQIIGEKQTLLQRLFLNHAQ